MEVGDASGATSLKPRNGFLRFCSYVGVLLSLLTGPAIMIVAFFAGDDWWIPMLVGAVASISGTPFALAMWRMIGREHRESMLLRDHGRPATGEILAIRPAAFGEETGVALTLRFTADNMPPFGAEYVCLESPEFYVGGHITAIVEPESGLFAIPTRRQLEARARAAQ